MTTKKRDMGPVEGPVKTEFILRVKKGMYKVVDRDCNLIPPIPCPDPERINETWDWGPGDEYECFKLVPGNTYYFEEMGRWTYKILVLRDRTEGVEVSPHPLKCAVPRCRRGDE